MIGPSSGAYQCEAEPDSEGRSRGVTPSSDGYQARGNGASQFANTAAYGLIGKDHHRRSRNGTGPRTAMAMRVAMLVAKAVTPLYVVGGFLGFIATERFSATRLVAQVTKARPGRGRPESIEQEPSPSA